MDNKALYKLSYGLFVLGSKADDKENACITNTCMQITSSPTKVAIAVINTNYTCDLIKQSGVFAVTILDISTPFSLIENFGYQSGRNADKFASVKPEHDINGCSYLKEHASAVLSCKVESSQDLGSHTLFIAEVIEAEVLGDNEPLTYAYYQANIKPKREEAKTDKKIVGWKCKICGYTYEGAALPEDFTCPWCGHGPEDFEPVYAE